MFLQIQAACFKAKFHSWILSVLVKAVFVYLGRGCTERTLDTEQDSGLNSTRKSIFVFCKNTLKSLIRLSYKDTSILVRHVNKTYPAAQYFSTPAAKQFLFISVLFKKRKKKKEISLEHTAPCP